MIIAKLRGGLGNQMFIYAFARYLAHKHNTELKLDISYYEDYHRAYELDKLNIIEQFATPEEINDVKTFVYKNNILIRAVRKAISGKEPKKKPSKTYILDSGIEFKPKYLKIGKNAYLEGLFQSEKFFLPVKDLIKKDFTLKEPVTGQNRDLLDEISKGNSVSLHVRRGDYITNAWANQELGLCPLEYYAKAINYIASRVKSPHFYIFSDDMEWTRDNLKHNHKFTCIEHNDSNSGELDMLLMSKCKHHIIANSSFSWWAAWLGESKGSVTIAPKVWFAGKSMNDTHVVPKRWIRL